MQMLGDESDTEQVDQSQKLESLGKLAGGIAHDFNNILSIVEGYANIALKHLREGRLEEAQLLKIIEASKRGAGLTRQLLAFSRQKIQMEQTSDLSDLVRQNAVILKPQLGDNIKFSFVALEGIFFVDCASDSMTQILLNLASNARDAMPDGGTFTVLIENCVQADLPPRLAERYPGRDFIRMMVEDTGTGMEESVKERIFEPFYTTKEQDKGTGLGLSVVYGLIEQMRGMIEVSSKPGFGTRFDLYLPLSKNRPDIATPAVRIQDAGTSLKGRTVLLAEDEGDLRHVLTDMLEDIGLHVLPASSGNDALVQQEDHAGRIDFLVTDVMMPGMNGAKLAEMFLSLRPETEVIFISGYPFLNTGGDFGLPVDAPCLSKPFHGTDLALALQGTLCRRKAG